MNNSNAKTFPRKTLALAISSLLSIPMAHASDNLWSCTQANNGRWDCQHTSEQKSHNQFQQDLSTTGQTSKQMPLNQDKHVQVKPSIPQQHTEKNQYKNPLGAPAKVLGWVKTRNSNPCSGYYLESAIDYPFKPGPSLANSRIDIQADRASYARQGTSILIGNVVVTQPQQQLSADKAQINRNAKTGKLSSIEAEGQVHLRQPGRLLVGTSARVNTANKTWDIQNPMYRMVMDHNYTFKPATQSKSLKITQLSGWGQAQSAYKASSGLIIMKDATFSTCEPEHSFWQIRAGKLKLSRATGRGAAYNSFLYIKDVPVFYTPYANFPIDKRRKSGFLFPTWGHSGKSGFQASVPFYWNIAPNYDATLTPQFLSQRGFQGDLSFRYLLDKPFNSYGQIATVWLPYDAEFKRFKKSAPDKFDPNNNATGALADNLETLKKSSLTRRGFSYKNKSKFSEHWTAYADFNYVSDDYFFQDINTSSANTASRNKLLRQLKTEYRRKNWNFLANLQGYQTLHPVNQAATSNSYNRLPQLQLNANSPYNNDTFKFRFTSEYVNFTKTKNPGASLTPVETNRFHIAPEIELPLSNSQAFYFKPKVKLDTTFYRLRHLSDNRDNNQTRILPIVDVDTGLNLDRQVNFGKTNYIQTLEPRLFYLYVPYVNQKDIPVFDSGIKTFNSSQLFSTNRFSGLDRVGDANQLTLSLSSRMLNHSTGTEKFSALIGEIIYFKDRRVNLCSGGSSVNCGSLDLNARRTDGTSDTSRLSPFIAKATYHFTNYWSATGSVAYDFEENLWNNANTYISYQPNKNHIVNFGYTFLKGGDIYQVPPGQSPLNRNDSKNNLNKLNASTAWRLTESWTALAQFNYNISHSYVEQYLAGLQYDSCCWAIRLVGTRYFRNLNQRSKPVFDNQVAFQFLFKGIGAIGTSDPGSMLRNNIQGYADPFASGAI